MSLERGAGEGKLRKALKEIGASGLIVSKYCLFSSLLLSDDLQITYAIERSLPSLLASAVEKLMRRILDALSKGRALRNQEKLLNGVDLPSSARIFGISRTTQ